MSRVAEQPTTATDTGHRVDLLVAGTRTEHWEYGDRAQPTLVAVHGLRGTHHGLVPLVSALHGHRVVVPDLPGFGASAPMADRHDVDGYARWLAAFLDAVRTPEGTVLLGHSFGSVLAAAAVAHGAPVRTLVLVNPITAPSSNRVRRAATGLAVLAHRAAARLPERAGNSVLRNRALTELMSTSLMTTEDPELRRWIRCEHRRHFGSFTSPRVLLEAFEAASHGHVDAFAPRIGVPTTLVAGGRDPLAPVRDQRVLAARFPDARLAVIPGTGHLTHYEFPGTVARVVEHSLSDTRARCG
jgi:pimeloyl-ACP methyl ester carboxylesterase